jgi:hypothetical protein
MMMIRTLFATLLVLAACTSTVVAKDNTRRRTTVFNVEEQKENAGREAAPLDNKLRRTTEKDESIFNEDEEMLMRFLGGHYGSVSGGSGSSKGSKGGKGSKGSKGKGKGKGGKGSKGKGKGKGGKGSKGKGKGKGGSKGSKGKGKGKGGGSTESVSGSMRRTHVLFVGSFDSPPYHCAPLVHFVLCSTTQAKEKARADVLYKSTPAGR